MIDNFNRTIDYLRISVIDRCNLRCVYCMPELDPAQKTKQEILSFEEITAIVKLCVSLGIERFKITGGEPLIRRDIAALLSMLVCVSGIKDLSLTTNGVFLSRHIQQLKKNGFKNINISLDTLKEDKFRQITKTNLFRDVLDGIDSAVRAGFFIKLNTVVMRGINDDEILSFARFARERKIIIRFIELMPVAMDERLSGCDLFVSCDEIKDKLKGLGRLNKIQSRFGNGPAQYYEIGEGGFIAGFISPISDKFCHNCNRLRLTADGFIMPCLSSSRYFDLKKPIRENKFIEARGLLKETVSLKPLEHNFDFCSRKEYSMSQIGG